VTPSSMRSFTDFRRLGHMLRRMPENRRTLERSGRDGAPCSAHWENSLHEARRNSGRPETIIECSPESGKTDSLIQFPPAPTQHAEVAAASSKSGRFTVCSRSGYILRNRGGSAGVATVAIGLRFAQRLERCETSYEPKVHPGLDSNRLKIPGRTRAASADRRSARLGLAEAG
jgi:hypothetical protein